MRIDQLRVGDEKKSVRVCAGFLCHSKSSIASHSRTKTHHTQFSHRSQLQLSTALLNTPRSPQHSTTHHTTTNTFTSVNSLLKLQSPLLIAAYLPCMTGRILYTNSARSSLQACVVKLSGSEYAPTGTPYSSYVVMIGQKEEQNTGAASSISECACEEICLRSRLWSCGLAWCL